MLYERIDVCRRLPDSKEAVVYRCLRTLPQGGFIVQSADQIRLPIVASEIGSHENRFWELFCEAAPEERSTSYSTLEEAIQAFDEEFGNVWK
jgi:hypothetical protein